MKAERQKAMVQPSRSLPMRRTNRPPRLQQTAAAHTSAAPRSLSAPVSISARRLSPAEPGLAALEEGGDALLVVLAGARQRELVAVHVGSELIERAGETVDVGL